MVCLTAFAWYCDIVTYPGAQSGIKGASTQIRTNQIPLLQTVGVPQQQQNILVSNQKNVTIQQPQFRQQQQLQQQLNQTISGQEQRTVSTQGTNIQIQNPTSNAVSRFRLLWLLTLARCVS